MKVHSPRLLTIVLSALVMIAAPAIFAQAPTASCSDDPATNTTTCRIDAPLVTQRITEYDGAFHPESFTADGNCNFFGCNQHFGVSLPGIFLSRGDLVTVNADGCAQTGGSGATWKRYVNPQGANADRLYHGLLGVLNAIEPDGTVMPNPIRIQDVLLQPFWIPAAQPLRLGYEDDDYRDNGYWGHDDGDPEQCNLDGSHGFGGNAFVIVTIQHNAPPPPGGPPMPWDIVQADSAVSVPFDFNALLFNPRWGWQTAVVNAPLNFDDCSSTSACTGQILTKDEPDFGNSLFTCGGALGFGARGHLNWTVVSYQGRIFWDSHSNPTFGDDDYNFNLNTLVTNGFPSGVTASNPQQVLLEFQARETIDHFQTPFWNDFHDAVDNNDTEAHIKVDNKEALVTGLLGLDRVHGSHSEVHPVFVLAIHTKSAPLDDTWAIFARNYGNEGWCSDNMHYANFNTVTLQLPRLILAPATASANIASGTQFFSNVDLGSNQRVDVFSAPNQDTFVTFHLPSPPADGEDGARIHGELHLQWTGTLAPSVAEAENLVPSNPVEAQASQAQASHRPTPLPAQASGPSGEPEARLAELFAQLSPQQQAIYLSAQPPRPAAFPDTLELAANTVDTAPSPSPTAPALTEVRDARQQEHREEIVQSFCGAMNGQVPPDLGTCANYPPLTQLAFTGSPNAAGWFHTDVTVTLTAINVSGKGIDHTEYSFDNQTWIRYAGPFVLGEGIFTIFYRSQDQSGTLEPTRSVTFKIDKTPPTIVGSRAPAANAHGWNNTNVVVSFTCSDNLSGLAAGSPPMPTTLSTEGAGQSVTGMCQDVAGNSATAIISGINIDKTPPTITAALNPPANADGWNNTDVTVVFSASDALSGVASVTSPVLVQSEGRGQTVTGSATDLAGNVNSVSVTVNLDKTPPEAFTQFDPVSHDVLLFGRDSLSGTKPGPITPTSVVPLSSGDDDDDAKEDDDRDDRKGELRTYSVFDLAGNRLLLKEKVRKTKHSISVQIVSLEYNNDRVLTPARNKQRFEWRLEKDGSLRELEQQIEIGKGKREREVSARFDAHENQTVIRDESKHGRTVLPGLVLLRVATDHGKLTIEF